MVSREGLMPFSQAVGATSPPLIVELEEDLEVEEEVIVTATRSGRLASDQATRVEVVVREEIEEKLLMTPGDIVMLLYTNDPEKSFVKRVVAEPGDSIRSVNGHVYRNEVPLPDDFIPEEFRSYDTWGPEIVREGYYFVMGDHRNNSSDSRTWGLVPKKYIIGRVQLRWWPLTEARLFSDWR